MLKHILSVLLVSTSLWTQSAASQPLDVREVCDSNTVLTLAGADILSGRVLFSLPSRHQGVGFWWIEVDSEGSWARLYPGNQEVRLSGAVAPGEILGALPCGPTCLQVVSWKEGNWVPMGGSLEVPEAATFHATWDRSGAPWAMILGVAGRATRFQASAYRLESDEWEIKGDILLGAVGHPAVAPAPGRPDAVVSGPALFSANEEARAWLNGVPSVPGRPRGQILAVDEHCAAYIEQEGSLLWTEDQGSSWLLNVWSPWGAETPNLRLEVPPTVVDGVLPGVFTRSTGTTLVLAERSPGERWQVAAEVPAVIQTDRGEELPFDHIVQLERGRWLLVSGCYSSPGGAGVALRSVDEGSVSSPRLVPFEAVSASSM